MKDTGAPWLMPYPEDNDSPDVPRDFKAQAQKAHANLDKAAYSDLTRCYFRLHRAAIYGMPIDGAVRLPFDTEAADPAGIATVGAAAGITCPRAGRMDLRWSVYMTTDSGPNPVMANLFSQLISGAGTGSEVRRGSQSVGPFSLTGVFISIGSATPEVTAGQVLGITANMSATGAGKQVGGGPTITWFEGYYLTP
jgi:hypothetical protein